MRDYPEVLSEEATIRHALEGRSIARFGDGELRLAAETGKHIAQTADKSLAAELRAMLQGPTKSLVCLPNVDDPRCAKPLMWGPTRYSADCYRALYQQSVYGSSFICRPDSAPWIDQDWYWELCRQIWRDKDVTLVIGTRGGSFTHLIHARSVRMIHGPERDAWVAIDQLVEQIGTPGHTVMICLGPAATILVERLSQRGVHALDLGHMGRFMPQKFQQPGIRDGVPFRYCVHA